VENLWSTGVQNYEEATLRFQSTDPTDPGDAAGLSVPEGHSSGQLLIPPSQQYPLAATWRKSARRTRSANGKSSIL